MPRCFDVEVVEFEALGEGTVQEGRVEGSDSLATMSETRLKHLNRIGSTDLIPASKRTLTFDLYIQYSLRSNLGPRQLCSHDCTG